MLKVNVPKEGYQDKIDSVQKKKVEIPSGAMCRFLIYDIDSPKKAKENAKTLHSKLTILQGADIKIAVLYFYDDKGKIKTVIDYSNPEDIQLPLGDTGFRNTLFFRCSKAWLNANGFVEIKTTDEAEALEEAELMFNLHLQKKLGIPIDMEKTGKGILFTGYRTWYIKKDVLKPDGTVGDQYQSDIRVVFKNNDEKWERLTQDIIKPEYLDEKITAAIWNTIDPDAFQPM